MAASFFPEGTQINLQDTEWKVLQKMLAATNAVGVTVAGLANVGSDGSNWVFKNGQSYLRDQYGLYHLAEGYIAEGQMQGGYENTGYTYDNIP